MKKAILNNAITLLENAVLEDLETIQINNTKYDDGSVGLSIELTYPAREDFEGETFKPEGSI